MSTFHFPFADRILSYDCHKCGYQCCGGFDTGVTKAGDLEALLALRPGLGAFSMKCNGGLAEGAPTDLKLLAPGCFLLDAQGSCEAESTLGRALKPWSCRLYPFSAISKIGEQFCFNISVIDHRIVCPFDFDGTGAGAISHAALEADIRSFANGWQGYAVACDGLAAEAEALLAAEKELRDALAAMPRRTSLPEVLGLATGLSAPDAAARRRFIGRRFRLEDVQSQDPLEAANECRIFMLMLPMVRMGFFTGFHWLGATVCRELLTDYLLLGSAFAANAARLSRKPLSPELVLRLFSKLRGFLFLGTLLDRAVSITDQPIEMPADSVEAKTLLYLLQKNKTTAFWRLLSEALAENSVGDRRIESVDDAVPYLGAVAALASRLIVRPL